MKANSAVVITVGLVVCGVGLLFGLPTSFAVAQGAPGITRTAFPTLTPTQTPTATTTATRKVFLPIVFSAEPYALEGSLKVLKINANPISTGSTAYASWSISNFRDGEFDKGDGRGYIGPIASAMRVDVPNVTSARVLRLRWRDLNGQEFEDFLTLIAIGATVTPAPTADCTPANPDWRGNSTAAYAFCVRKDLDYVSGGAPVRYFNVNQDVVLTLDWHIYGINGIRFVVEPSGQLCGPQGTSVVNVPASGLGSYTFNVNQLAYGGYIVHLKVTRKDNVEVNYNEKFLCIGNGPNSATPLAPTPTPFPFTPVPTSTSGGEPPTPIP